MMRYVTTTNPRHLWTLVNLARPRSRDGRMPEFVKKWWERKLDQYAIKLKLRTAHPHSYMGKL